MNQKERLAAIAVVDREISKLEIKVKEAKGRLLNVKAWRAQLLVDCTHKKANGRTAIESGMFGKECTICQWKDF